MYQVTNLSNCIAVMYGDTIIETFDFNERREADKLLNELENIKCFEVSFLIAKSRWVTREGKKIQVPVEEFRREFRKVNAGSEEEATRVVMVAHRASAVIRDVRAEIAPFTL